jgi:hypothetical protein
MTKASLVMSSITMNTMVFAEMMLKDFAKAYNLARAESLLA